MKNQIALIYIYIYIYNLTVKTYIKGRAIGGIWDRVLKGDMCTAKSVVHCGTLLFKI